MVYLSSLVLAYLYYKIFQETEPAVDESGQAHGKGTQKDSLSTVHSIAQKAAEARQIRVGFTHTLTSMEDTGKISSDLYGRRRGQNRSGSRTCT